MKNIIILIAAIITFSSCEKTVTIDIPYEGDKLVMNSFLRSDSFVYVSVSKSIRLNTSITPTEPNVVTAQLLENGIIVGNLNKKTILGQNYYVSSIKAKIGATYKVKMGATGFTNIEGEDIIPAKPNCSTVSFVQSSAQNKAKLLIKINDPLNIKNYYLIRLRTADTNLIATGNRYKIDKSSIINFTTKDQSNNEAFDLLSDNYYDELVIADHKFNGKDITLTLDIEYYDVSNLKYISPEIVSLSQSAYRYILSKENQLNNQGNPFSEPSLIYSNIKNGYGIIAGTADSVLVIKKK